MKTAKCCALDRLLEEGWFDSEKEAQAWVMTRRVLVDNVPLSSVKERIRQDGSGLRNTIKSDMSTRAV